MARPSILSDELVRQLVAVGQVDILVGVPTFNNAPTIASIVKTLHVGLAKHFPRERTVLISPDGGSDDGTPDLVRTAPLADAERQGSSSLRTTHRVTAPYRGIPGRANGVRTVFAAADLLQARAVVMIDANLTSLTPDWAAELARPVWRDEADLVLPIHPRNRFDGPLVNQIVRPLLGSAFARRLRANLTGDFGCSGLFATRLVGHAMWEGDLTRASFDVWLVATALAEDLRLGQVHLGPCLFASRAPRAGLPELFEQVVGTAFACLDQHAAAWVGRTDPVDVPVSGTPREPEGPDPAIAPALLVERFRSGVRDLEPLLREILAPDTLGRLQAVAASGDEVPRLPDPLWVETVYEFAASAHHGVMNREHLTQALVPLYLGRTASFFAEIAAADEAAHRERIAALETEYQNLRPHLLERWNDEGRR
jgi:hypothetical protein